MLFAVPVALAAPIQESTLTEFATADAWYAGLDDAERQFGEMLPQWIRLEAVTPFRVAGEETLGAALNGYQAQQRELETNLAAEKSHLEEAKSAFQEKQAELALAHSGEEARLAAATKARADQEETAERVKQAYLNVQSVLPSVAGRASVTARRDLAAWWALYKNEKWEDILAGVEDSRAMEELGAVQDQALISCRTAGAVVESSCASLMTAVGKDLAARRTARDTTEMVRGLTDVKMARLEEESLVYEREVADTQRRIAIDEGKYEANTDQIAAIEETLKEAKNPESNALAPVYGRLEALNLLYGSLLRGLIGLDGQMDQDRWCRLYIHAGMARTMAGAPGGVDLLRVAAGSHDSVCRIVMAGPEFAHVPLFQAAWAQALLLAAQAGQTWLWVPLGQGTWVIDGVALDLASASLVPEVPGTHRIEYRPPGGLPAARMEDLPRGQRLLVSWNSDGEVALDAYPIGTVENPNSIVPMLPVRPGREPTPRGPDGVPLSPLEAEGVSRFSVAARYGRLDGLDLLGGSASAAWRFARTRWFRLDAGLALDALHSSETAYAVSGSWSTSTLPRVRGIVGIQTAPGPVRFSGEVSAGVVAPLAAAVMTGDLGVALRLGEHRYVQINGGVSVTAWAAEDGAPLGSASLGPELSIGVARWE